MIGRYKDPGAYKQLLQTSEVYALVFGITFIVLSFIFGKMGIPLTKVTLAPKQVF